MQKKFESKGVILVALSYEATGVVAPYVSQHKISYIVGGDAKATRDAFGISGYPTAFLVDPEGKVAWTGHPMTAEKAIEKLLKEKPPHGVSLLAEDAGKSALDDAGNLYEQKKYAQALKAYELVAKDFKGTKVAEAANAKVSEIEGNATIMAEIRAEAADRNAGLTLDMARVLAKHGARNDAIRYYKRIVADYPESRHADAARREVEKLRGG